MAENESFFRKVVRFVANPATDWTDLSSRQDDSRELELEKSELKAMIERKRRNDFVRKREFDMLRRVRREGLSPEQLAALGTSSRLDDSEARLPDAQFGPHRRRQGQDRRDRAADGRRRGLQHHAQASAAGYFATSEPAAFNRESGAPAAARRGRRTTTTERRFGPQHRSGDAAPLSLPPAEPRAGPGAGGQRLPPLAPLSTVSFATGPAPALAPHCGRAMRANPPTSAARLRSKSPRSCTTPNSTRP
jgi:hypothetical protein